MEQNQATPRRAAPQPTRRQRRIRRRLRLVRNWVFFLGACAGAMVLMTTGILWLLPKAHALIAGPEVFEAQQYDGSAYTLDLADGRLALVNANSRAALVGNYQGTSSRYITPLEGIQQYVGDNVRVTYAEGCHLYKNKVEGLGEDKDRFKEAVIAAEHADVVVLCLGLDATVEGEEGDAGNEYASGDKLGLNLPGLQEELLETITAVGKPVVLVLSAGSAIDLSWAEEHVPAILDSWYPGARGGKAVAEALFGDYAPNGKLPVTFYQGTENLPEFTDYSMAGRTYRYTDKNILYPFGYGLTYGTISYSGAKTEQETSAVLDDVTVCTKVKNESAYPLHESVEVYVKYKNAQPGEPGFQLKGIACVELQAGEEKEVSVTLHARDFAVITEDGGCVVRPGEYEISIGGQQPGERSRALTGRETEILTVRKEGNEENVEY